MYTGTAFKARHIALLKQYTDVVEHLLRAAHREGGDDDIAACAQRTRQHLLKLLARVALVVQPVAVGALYNDDIRFIDIGGILE